MIELERLLRQLVREELRAALSEAGMTGPARHVTVQEYAAARSLSVSTVRTAIRTGRLPAMRIGRAVRVCADAEITQPTATRPHRSGAPQRTATARAAASLGLGVVR